VWIQTQPESLSGGAKENFAACFRPATAGPELKKANSLAVRAVRVEDNNPRRGGSWSRATDIGLFGRTHSSDVLAVARLETTFRSIDSARSRGPRRSKARTEVRTASSMRSTANGMAVVARHLSFTQDSKRFFSESVKTRANLPSRDVVRAALDDSTISPNRRNRAHRPPKDIP